jgi:hypothetical protein
MGEGISVSDQSINPCFQQYRIQSYERRKKTPVQSPRKLKKEIKRYPERAKPMDRSLWTVLPFSMHEYEALHSGIVSLKLKKY